MTTDAIIVLSAALGIAMAIERAQGVEYREHDQIWLRLWLVVALAVIAIAGADHWREAL